MARVEFKRALIATVLASLLALPALAQQPAAPPAAAPAAAPAAPPPAAPAAAPPPAAKPAQPPLPAEVLEPVSRLSKSIESAEKSIQQLKELEGELARLRSDVERIIYDSTSTAETLRPQLATVKDQIEKLGPPPSKDQPPETETVAAERARLNAQVGALDSAIKTTELAWVRAKQLIDRITVIRYQMFTKNLLERRDSPALPGLWRDVGSRLESIAGRVQYYGGDWVNWVKRKSGQVWAYALAILAGFAIATWLVHRVVQPRLVRPPGPRSPSFFQRVAQAAWIAPLRMAPAAAAVIAAYAALDNLDLLFSPWEGTANALLSGLLVFIAASTLVGTAFAPRHPAWRLIPVADATASRLVLILNAFLAVYVLDTVLVEFSRAIYVPLVVTVAQSFLMSVLFTGLLVYMLLTRFEQQIGPDRPVNGHEFVPGRVTRFTPYWVKFPLWGLAAAILLTSLAGYVALGRFIAHQLVLSGMVIAAAGLLYLAVRAVTRGRGDGQDLVGNLLAARLGLDGPRRRQFSRLVEFTVTLAIALLATPALLLQWGYSGVDIRDWSTALLFGFEVGHFRISLVRILLAVALFTGLLFATRMLQRWLRDQVLAQSRMDAGIANSIDIAVGYAGIALSSLLAVSYAGLDVTNLAIVAGALSVGIGFGLQSIVNNFVSGLILLVERPIKVGDWIVVGDQQGNVRRISVRSTEIETFDRASLIVPNSELISGRVLNWTHRNLLGRTMVKLTVDPNADPDTVMKTLRSIADTHPDVLKQPPPVVSFDGFSSGGLDYTIRVTLPDVTRSGAVSTELRTSALKALRQAHLLVGTPAAEAAAATPPLELAVTVDPTADPELALRVLRACAEAYPGVARTPAPAVTFDRFDARGLDFTLRVHIPENCERLTVSNELRALVLKALRQAGLVRVNQHLDVHLRDLDFLKALVQRVIESRNADGNGRAPETKA